MNTRQVKDTIKSVFYNDLGGAKYLLKVAKNDPALFCSLWGKLVPQEVRDEVNVNVRQMDIGAAMREANTRLMEMHSIDARPPVLEPNPIPFPE